MLTDDHDDNASLFLDVFLLVATVTFPPNYSRPIKTIKVDRHSALLHLILQCFTLKSAWCCSVLKSRTIYHLFSCSRAVQEL